MNWIERISRRIYINALDRRIAKDCGYDPPYNLRQVIETEIRAVEKSIGVAAEWQEQEINVLTDRLTRRYDVGMALNESSNRAQKARKAAGQEPEDMPLTANQKKALAFQAQYLKKVREL